MAKATKERSVKAEEQVKIFRQLPIEEQIVVVLRFLSLERKKELLDFAIFLGQNTRTPEAIDKAMNEIMAEATEETFSKGRVRRSIKFPQTPRLPLPDPGDLQWEILFVGQQEAIDDWANTLLKEANPTTGIESDGNTLRPTP